MLAVEEGNENYSVSTKPPPAGRNYYKGVDPRDTLPPPLYHNPIHTVNQLTSLMTTDDWVYNRRSITDDVPNQRFGRAQGLSTTTSPPQSQQPSPFSSGSLFAAPPTASGGLASVDLPKGEAPPSYELSVSHQGLSSGSLRDVSSSSAYGMSGGGHGGQDDYENAIAHSNLIGQMGKIALRNPPPGQQLFRPEQVPPFGLFLGQVKFEMSCVAVVDMLRDICGIAPVWVETRRQGCFIVWFRSNEEKLQVQRLITKNVLFDYHCVWFGRDENETLRLQNYVQYSLVRNTRLPYNLMVVEELKDDARNFSRSGMMAQHQQPWLVQ